MLYSFKNREDLENSNELVSLKSQVKAVRLQEKFGKQNFHEDIKKVFEPVSKSIKDASEGVTKTMAEKSIKNNRALENLIDKLLEIMKGRAKIASYLVSHLSKFTNPKKTGQFFLVKDLSSKRLNDLLLIKPIPVTLYNNLLTFHDTDKKFELDGDISKMMIKKIVGFCK